MNWKGEQKQTVTNIRNFKLAIFMIFLMFFSFISFAQKNLAHAQEQYIWVESESVLNGSLNNNFGAVREKYSEASGNFYVTNGTSEKDFLSYEINVPADMENGMLSIRYSCPIYHNYFKMGRKLKIWNVSLDGSKIPPLIFPPTIEPDIESNPVWSFTSIPLGKVSRGQHILHLEPMKAGGRHSLDIDGFYIHDGIARFAADSKSDGILPKPVFVTKQSRSNAKQNSNALIIHDKDIFVILDKSEWRTIKDPGNEGELNNWHEASFSDQDWATIGTASGQGNRNSQNYDGATWFRRTINIPLTWKEKDVRLYIDYFGQYGWIYLNGRLIHVCCHTDPHGGSYVPGGMDGIGSKNVSELLNFGGENVIAIKIWDNENSLRNNNFFNNGLLYATERFEDSGGMFHIVSPDKSEEYGIIIGYYSDAMISLRGFTPSVLSQMNNFFWTHENIEKIPIPRHLINSNAPVCIAKKSELETFLKTEPYILDIRNINPFAMKTDDTGILSIKALPEKNVGQYEKFEIDLDISANYSNPYDPEDICVSAYFTAPSGRNDRGWAFFNQDFTPILQSDSQNIFPVEGSSWKILFAPSEPGEYSYFVYLDDGTKGIRSETRSFICEPSGENGFVRVSEKDPRYLEYDSGKPFYILGSSGWQSQDLLSFDQEFKTKNLNHENFDFFATFRFGQIHTAPLVYSQMPFSRMDHIVQTAEKYGIKLQVFYDEIRRGSFEDKPYYRGNGGTCDNREMVYTNEFAREMSKNLIRYFASRYAYSPSILLWGFGDEVWRSEPIMQKWIREMVDEFRNNDPHEHIAIVGEGKNFLTENGDMTDLGGWYVHLNEESKEVGAEDMAEYMEFLMGEVGQAGKAVFSSEGGLCEIGPALGKSSRDYIAFNGEMIHLHNQIWSSFMFGFCGAGTEWLRTNVNDLEQHYHHKAFGEYIVGEPLPSLGLKTIKPSVSNNGLRALGLKGDGKVYVWIQNRQNTWYKLTMEKLGIDEIPASKLKLDNLENGRWTVEWWDTYTGKVTAASEVNVEKNQIEINLSPILKDIAIKMSKK